MNVCRFCGLFSTNAFHRGCGAKNTALRKKKMKFIIIIACFDINKAKKDVNMWEKGNYYYYCLWLRCFF